MEFSNYIFSMYVSNAFFGQLSLLAIRCCFHDGFVLMRSGNLEMKLSWLVAGFYFAVRRLCAWIVRCQINDDVVHTRGGNIEKMKFVMACCWIVFCKRLCTWRQGL